MRLDFDTPLSAFNLPLTRRVTYGAVARWLAAGWRDFRANVGPSLAYGLLFGMGGDLIILAALDNPHLVMVAISGFFLLAPFLAVGLYELSRAREAGERLMFVDSLRAFRRNTSQLALFALLLALAVLLWERFTAIAFNILGLAGAGSGLAYLLEIVTRGEHLAFVGTWVAMGGILALFIFAIGVVAVPLMVGRDCDTVTAMVTSLHAFARNPGPLLLWAAVIVVLVTLGFASLLFGMVVIMPILGHASWHAYRDLVE